MLKVQSPLLLAVLQVHIPFKNKRVFYSRATVKLGVTQALRLFLIHFDLQVQSNTSVSSIIN